MAHLWEDYSSQYNADHSSVSSVAFGASNRNGAEVDGREGIVAQYVRWPRAAGLGSLGPGTRCRRSVLGSMREEGPYSES